MHARDLDSAFATAARQVEDDGLPFVILGVANRDGVIRTGAAGSPGGRRIGPTAVCLLASVTKPIVATAVLRLAQEGRFPLGTPLGRWLPELDEAGLAPFTAWHVLTHTSGLGDIDLVTLLLEGHGRDELVRRTIASGQLTPPGSAFRYTSFSFDLLTEAVQRKLGAPFEDLLRETVLDPLGMVDTAFDPPPPERRAPVEIGNFDGSLMMPPGVTSEQAAAAFASVRLAGGGLWSTAGDLLRFGRAMLRGGELDGVRVLGRPVVDMMTREVTVGGLGASPSGDRLSDDRYAMAWGKTRAGTPGSSLAFGHGGVSGTRLWVDPAEDLVFVYLTGLWGGADPLMDDVQLAIYGAIA